MHRCCKEDALMVSDLIALLEECPKDACVSISTGAETGINVSWKDGYFSIPAPQSKLKTTISF